MNSKINPRKPKFGNLPLISESTEFCSKESLIDIPHF